MSDSSVRIDIGRARTASADLAARASVPADLAVMIRRSSTTGDFLAEASHGLALLDEVVEEVSLLSELYSVRADLAVSADNLPSLAAYQAYMSSKSALLDTISGLLVGSLVDDVTFDRVEVSAHVALADLEARVAGARSELEARVPELEARLAELEAMGDTSGPLEWLGDMNPFAESRGENREYERTTIEALLNLLEPSAATGGPRQFLLVDDSPGDHRLVEIVGNLDEAERVVVHIPGMTTQLQNYDGGGHSNVTNLYREADRLGGEGTVVISFMDYNVPQDVPAAASGAGADSGVEPLQSLLHDVNSAGIDRADITIVAHSYGSVVAGHAMQDGVDVARVITVGSPGMAGGANDRSELGSPDVELWAGRAGSDPVRFAPRHGEDPGDNGFGAHRFPVDGASGHSEYFKPMTDSLCNVADLAIGGQPEC